MSNDIPGWVDDAPMNWAPERVFQPPEPRPGPWSPPVTETKAEIQLGLASSGLLGRISIGLAQGLFFYCLFAARAAGLWPGADPYLFDALALAGLFALLLLLDGIGFVPARWLIPFTIVTALLLVLLGWYHRWRILGAEQSHAGISLLVLCAIALFIGQTFLRGRTRGDGYAALFEAGWSLAARLMVWALMVGAALVLINLPWMPRSHLEQGDVFAMPLLGLVSALAFQLAAAWPRFTHALKDALVASMTIALPLACAAALLLVSRALAQSAVPLVLLLAAMLALVLGVNASHRGGGGDEAPRKAWRDSAECFGAFLLLILAGLAAWSLELRVAAFGWTAARIFAAIAVAFFAAYGLGASAAALMGLAGRGWMRGLQGVNIVLGLLLMASCLALASPIADPMRLAAAAQAARLNDGRIPIEHFDFANLARDGGRFGAEALAAMGRGPYPDIAHAAALTSNGRPAADAPNPTEIGANIAVRTLGARLPATLLARDWSGVAAIPPCLAQASQSCDAYFMDMDGDGGDEILLVSGSESRWWGAVMKADAAGRWAMAGRIAAPACGPSLSDLRAGRFTLAPPLPGFKDMDIGGMRLSVVPSSAGCSHY